MKKRTKAGLVALIAPFVMMGCGGDGNATVRPQTLNATQKSEAYTTLQTLSSKPLYDTTEQSGAQLTVKLDSEIESSTDFSKSGLGATAIKDLKDNMLSGFGDIDFELGAKGIVGYKPDGTGYMKTYMNLFGISAMVGQEVTKKVGSDYLNYSCETNLQGQETKTVSKVDANYAKNTYDIFSVVESEEVDNVLLYDKVLDVITANNSYDEFVLDTTDLSKELILGSQNEYFDNSQIDFSLVTSTAKVDMILTDGVYELTIDMDIDHLYNEIQDRAMFLDLESEVVVKFDKNSIKSIGVEVTVDSESTGKAAELLDDDGSNYGVTFGDNNTLTQDIEVTTSVMVSTDTFNESMLNSNFSDYVGTGENGIVENKKVNITLECVNFSDLVEIEVYDKIPFGGNLMEVLNTLTSEESDLEDFDIKFYWDQECTREVSITDLLPSHDLTIYFKVSAKDGSSYLRVVSKPGKLFSWTVTEGIKSANTVITFSDYLSEREEIVEVRVNGEVVTAETLTLENKGIYDILIVVKQSN